MIHNIREIIWGPWTMILFLGVGVLYTLKSGFFQIRKIPLWWKTTAGSIGKKEQGEHKNSITKFQTACTALAATLGTGNIVGVATALTAGGCGALFWMWLSAGIGMMTAYAETMLGIKYRYRDAKGNWISGPMVYLDRGLGCKGLGKLYGFFCVLASFGMGSMVQSNSISETLEYSFSLPPHITGLFVTALVLLVTIGGISRIAYVSERLVPVSAGIYMFFSAIIVLSCYNKIPGILREIWVNAWTPASVVGGAAGYGISRSMQYGISRGVFSNEAGLGSMAILHGAAENTTPQEQGMWAMFEVFFDTILSCTLTAFVILCMADQSAYINGLDGAALTAYSFSKKLGPFGEYVISGSMLLFAFATIIAWFYLGKQSVSYLIDDWKIMKKNKKLKKAIQDYIYPCCYFSAVFIGCMARLETVWELSDIWNGVMAFPNIAALLFLIKEVEFPCKAKKTRSEKTDPALPDVIIKKGGSR